MIRLEDTTTILLEAGSEDKALYRELDRVIYSQFGGVTKELVGDYPEIAKLYTLLRDTVLNNGD